MKSPDNEQSYLPSWGLEDEYTVSTLWAQRGDLYFVLSLEDNSALHIVEISRMENGSFQTETLTSINRYLDSV